MGITLMAEAQQRKEGVRPLSTMVPIKTGRSAQYYDGMIADLSHPFPAKRAQAATELGAAPPVLKDKAVASLIGALNDDSAKVRREAASSLGLLGDKRATLPLARLLNDTQAVNTALGALEKLKDENAVPAIQALIIRQLEGKMDGNTLLSAVDALGGIGDLHAAPALAALLEYPLLKKDATLMIHVIQALGSIGDAGAITPLMNVAVNDENATIRSYAREAVHKLGGIISE
jgi:HEAT repeat protein